MAVSDTVRRGGARIAQKVKTGKEILDEHWFSYLFFLPTLLFLVLLVWFPFLRGIWMSFHQWPAFQPNEWVGLDNYTFILGWDAFYTSLRATVIYASATVLQLGLALAAALSVKHIRRFSNLLNGLYLIPYTMPPVVTGTIWFYLLHPMSGPVFGYLKEWGILEQSVFWRSNSAAGMTVITLVAAWTFWQFMFLVLLASLENIPDEHYETAKIYGANRVQRFLKVTLPQLKSAILVAVSIRIIWNLVKVSQPLQMTGGGPGYDTSVLAILLYRFTMEQQQYGLAFALGVVLLLLTIGFTALFIREFQRASGGVGQ